MEGEQPQKECTSCHVGIRSGTMCGRCFAITKKYYRACGSCGAKDIKPEEDDSVTLCASCREKAPSSSEYKCVTCNGPVDAKWKKTCTDCWRKENGAKSGGVCKDCNRKLDAVWKTQCTDCWKASKAVELPREYRCTVCSTKVDASWKRYCDPCYLQARIKK